MVDRVFFAYNVFFFPMGLYKLLIRIAAVPILLLLLQACMKDRPQSITVAVAANVQFAIDTLASYYEKETGTKVNIILGSSGKLTAQILQGAPYDVFLSADMKYPLEIFKQNLAVYKPEVYAYGTLVLWSLSEPIRSDSDLVSNVRIRKIALANPKTAPFGVAAVQFLENSGFYETLKPKLVFGESISQVNQFVTTQTADAGFTSKSVVLSKHMKNSGCWIEIDTGKYNLIEQGIVLIKSHNKKPHEAEKFYDFLLSEKAKRIFSDFGYKTEVPQ